MIHTLSGRTEIIFIGSGAVNPTTLGLRIQPVDKIVYPRGCWDSQVGSEEIKGIKKKHISDMIVSINLRF